MSAIKVNPVVVHHDCRTRGSKRGGVCRADSATGTGDQCHASRQFASTHRQLSGLHHVDVIGPRSSTIVGTATAAGRRT